MTASPLTRRDWLRLTTLGFAGLSQSGWLEHMACAAAPNPKRKRSCILLWMNGGPSTIDLWDLKPGHANGGSFKEIATTVPGIKISEHLPKLAKQMKHMAIVRSMKTKEADHGRGTYLMRTGRAPGGVVNYPTLGSLIAKELDTKDAELPGFVSIGPARFLSAAAWSPGFLGPRFAPLVVGEGNNFIPAQGRDNLDRALKVQDLDRDREVSEKRSTARVKLLDEMQDDFLTTRPGSAALGHRTAYHRAVALMKSQAIKAFDLDEEPRALRERYGRNLFGQGCLLARRLVQKGVPFIEVSLNNAPGVGGWDTHTNNFPAVKSLSSVLDAGFATLIDDLADKGLLATTTIVWMGEFGRTPKINGSRGRDHWANSWATVLAGGGIKGGQIVGKTSDDGMEVKERPVSVPDFLGTVGKALGLDISKQNNSNVNRPIRFVDPGEKVIKEVLS